jgi:AraC-like DNA-binding protein
MAREAPGTLPVVHHDLWRYVRCPHDALATASPRRARVRERGADATELYVDSADAVGTLMCCRIAPELVLVSACCERIPAERARYTGDGLWMLTARAEGGLTTADGGSTALRAAAIYFPPGAELTWQTPDVGPWHSVTVIASTRALNQRWTLRPLLLDAMRLAPADLDASGPPIVRAWAATRCTTEILREWGTFDVPNGLLRPFCEGVAIRIVCEILRGLPAGTRARRRSQRVSRQVSLVRQALLADPSKRHRLGQLAREHGLNRRQLAEEFRVQFDESVFGFLKRERMRCAWDLLCGSPVKVSEVATRVGYRDAASFARAFKEHFGVPPTYASRKARGEQDAPRDNAPRTHASADASRRLEQ